MDEQQKPVDDDVGRLANNVLLSAPVAPAVGMRGSDGRRSRGRPTADDTTLIQPIARSPSQESDAGTRGGVFLQPVSSTIGMRGSDGRRSRRRLTEDDVTILGLIARDPHQEPAAERPGDDHLVPQPVTPKIGMRSSDGRRSRRRLTNDDMTYALREHIKSQAAISESAPLDADEHFDRGRDAFLVDEAATEDAERVEGGEGFDSLPVKAGGRDADDISDAGSAPDAAAAGGAHASAGDDQDDALIELELSLTSALDEMLATPEPGKNEALIKMILSLPPAKRSSVQRDRLRECIGGVSFLAILDDEELLTHIFNGMEYRAYAPDEQIVSPTGTPEAVYIVLRGSVCLQEAPLGATAVDPDLLARGQVSHRTTRLAPETSWGQLSLVESHMRNGYSATAAHVGGCALLFIPRNVYQRVLPTFERRMRHTVALLQSTKTFGNWDTDSLQRLFVVFERLSLAEGDVLCNQGEDANFCFLISRGACGVYINVSERVDEQPTQPSAESADSHDDDNNDEARAEQYVTRLRQVAVLQAGTLVGETALLFPGQKRNATIISHGAEVLLLTKRDFLSLDEATLQNIRLNSSFTAACSMKPEHRETTHIDALVEKTQSLDFFKRMDDGAHRDLCKRLLYLKVEPGARIIAPPPPGVSEVPDDTKLGKLRSEEGSASAGSDVVVLLSGEVSTAVHLSVDVAGRYRSGVLRPPPQPQPAIDDQQLPASAPASTAAAARLGNSNHKWHTQVSHHFQIERTVRTGGAFGEMAAALGEEGNITATAVKETELLVISRDDYERCGALERYLGAHEEVANFLLTVDVFRARAPHHGGRGAGDRSELDEQLPAPEASARDYVCIAPFFGRAHVPRGEVVAASRKLRRDRCMLVMSGASKFRVDGAELYRERICTMLASMPPERTAASFTAAMSASSTAHELRAIVEGNGEGTDTLEARRARARAHPTIAEAIAAVTSARAGGKLLHVAVLGAGTLLTEETLLDLCPEAPWSIAAETALETLLIDSAELHRMLTPRSREVLAGKAAATRAWVSARLESCMQSRVQHSPITAHLWGRGESSSARVGGAGDKAAAASTSVLELVKLRNAPAPPKDAAATAGSSAGGGAAGSVRLSQLARGRAPLAVPAAAPLISRTGSAGTSPARRSPARLLTRAVDAQASQRPATSPALALPAPSSTEPPLPTSPSKYASNRGAGAQAHMHLRPKVHLNDGGSPPPPAIGALQAAERRAARRLPRSAPHSPVSTSPAPTVATVELEVSGVRTRARERPARAGMGTLPALDDRHTQASRADSASPTGGRAS